MKKHTSKILGTICGLVLVASTGLGMLSASATTVSDVIAHAYAVGLPESTIQQCINAYGGGTYTSDQCDMAIAALDAWAAECNSAIEDAVEEGSDDSSDTETSSSSSTESETEETEETTSASTEVTDEEIIEMTLEEKVAYVNSLSEEEQEDFMENMSTEVRNSFLKQLDTDAQLEVVASLIDVGDALDVSFSVDSIDDDTLVIAARDADGNLIDLTTFGDTVEETGYAYTVPILIGVGAIVLAVTGFVIILLVDRKKNKTCEDQS